MGGGAEGDASLAPVWRRLKVVKLGAKERDCGGVGWSRAARVREAAAAARGWRENGGPERERGRGSLRAQAAAAAAGPRPRGSVGERRGGAAEPSPRPGLVQRGAGAGRGSPGASQRLSPSPPGGRSAARGAAPASLSPARPLRSPEVGAGGEGGETAVASPERDGAGAGSRLSLATAPCAEVVPGAGTAPRCAPGRARPRRTTSALGVPAATRLQAAGPGETLVGPAGASAVGGGEREPLPGDTGLAVAFLSFSSPRSTRECCNYS